MSQKTDSTKIRADVCAKVVGYAREVSNWNKGKQQEFKDRFLLKI